MLVTFYSKGTFSCTKCISENVSQNSSTFYSCLFLIFSVSYSLNLRAPSIFRSFKLFREVWCYWMSCLSLSLCWLATKVIHLLPFPMWLITITTVTLPPPPLQLLLPLCNKQVWKSVCQALVLLLSLFLNFHCFHLKAITTYRSVSRELKCNLLYKTKDQNNFPFTFSRFCL